MPLLGMPTAPRARAGQLDPPSRRQAAIFEAERAAMADVAASWKKRSGSKPPPRSAASVAGSRSASASRRASRGPGRSCSEPWVRFDAARSLR